jgi:hypothetical protein
MEPTHMLLLWEDGSFRPESYPGEHAATYTAWLREVEEDGTLITGDELAPARAYAGPETTGEPDDDSPIAPGPDARVSGFFLVRAGSMEAAARIAATHPHRENGGWIEVAEIVRR